MPSMQFSFVPWQYDEETINICRKAVKLHEEVVTPLVMEAAKETVDCGNHGRSNIQPQKKYD